MLGDLMELAPLASVFLCLPIVLIFLHLRLSILRLSILDISFVLQVGASFSLLLL
jgi:hypothetical protein